MDCCSLGGPHEATRPHGLPPNAIPQDSDAVVLQDPLPHFNPAYDVQSIADWSGPEMPRVGATLTASCNIYRWVPDKRTATGAARRGWGGVANVHAEKRHPPALHNHQAACTLPCRRRADCALALRPRRRGARTVLAEPVRQHRRLVPGALAHGARDWAAVGAGAWCLPALPAANVTSAWRDLFNSHPAFTVAACRPSASWAHCVTACWLLPRDSSGTRWGGVAWHAGQKLERPSSPMPARHALLPHALHTLHAHLRLPLQTTWNEVIVPFLWGVGDEPPLRYRLLPIRSFFAAVDEQCGGGV